MPQGAKAVVQLLWSIEGRNGNVGDCNDCDSITVIGGNLGDKHELYENVSRELETLLFARTLIFNPIFDVQRANSHVKLHIQWPSEFYQAEFGEVERYFGKYTAIGLDVTKQQTMDELARNFIVIPVPDGLVGTESHLRVDVGERLDAG